MGSAFEMRLHHRERTVLLTKHCTADQIEKNEIGGVCSTYGGQERSVHGLVRKPEGK